MHGQGQARPGQGGFVELWLAVPGALSNRRLLRVPGAVALLRVRRLWAREWVV